MNEIEKQLLGSLIELQNAVDTMSTAKPRQNLLPLFARLDELALELPKGTDPLLLHYLHNKSYQKARALLEGRESENVRGSCGHG